MANVLNITLADCRAELSKARAVAARSARRNYSRDCPFQKFRELEMTAGDARHNRIGDSWFLSGKAADFDHAVNHFMALGAVNLWFQSGVDGARDIRFDDYDPYIEEINVEIWEKDSAYAPLLPLAKSRAMRSFILAEMRDARRVTSISWEADGVFIYTDSTQWCDDAGAGTFRGDTEAEAMAHFLKRVVKAEPVSGFCRNCLQPIPHTETVNGAVAVKCARCAPAGAPR